MAGYVRLDEQGLAELFDGPDSVVGRYLARQTVRVERRAKQLCAVDTGRLRSSVTHELGEDGAELIGRVGTNVVYARYVETGTIRMRAQPFLRPALSAAAGSA